VTKLLSLHKVYLQPPSLKRPETNLMLNLNT